MNIEKLKEIAEEIAIKQGLKLYSCVWNESGEDGPELEVEVDKPSMVNLDEITEYSEKLSDALDDVSELDSVYNLNVHSADPEREITGENLNDYLTQYVLVKTKDEKEVEGELTFVTDETLTLKAFVKGRLKVWEIPHLDVVKINLRIKI